MTQPPDDRTRPPGEPGQPDEPGELIEPASDGTPPSTSEDTVAPDAPTVAWTPPGDETSPPAAGAEGPPPAPAPESPIISAEPSTPTASGWAAPGAPPPVPTPAGGGGWDVSGGVTGQTLLRDGYVAGGAGARFVAWLIDSLVSAIVPGALFLFLLDWPGLFRAATEQMQFDANGRLIPGATYNFTFPVTLELVLLYLILVGVQFLYFVGFWTSRYQATPGMIGLKMRVVDANTGATLSLLQATKRWFAMGWWLALLALVPALQSASSLFSFAVNFFIFVSIIGNDRRQGFHDKFANSQVIRSVTSGSGATIVGCLAFGVMAILLSIAAGLAFLAIAGPELSEIVRDMPRYQP